MSLLGLDVGTTGSKAVVFSDAGEILSSAYEEYDISRPAPGLAELDAQAIWPRICETIRRAVNKAADAGAGITGQYGPVTAVAVDSMGENLVPVSADRKILGPSIMNMDSRGSEYLLELASAVPAEELYQITGNTLSSQYSIVMLMWMLRNQRKLYDSVDYFLPWNSFVSFMLGAEPVTEYALANRTLLFDIGEAEWSARMVEIAGLDGAKLARPVPAGTPIGQVSGAAADLTGLEAGTAIVMGAHDQPSASLGSGAFSAGTAMYGMGTFHCIAPSFSGAKPPAAMIARGLTAEHHAVPDLFITMIYNSGGSVVKWFRDTFAPDGVTGGGATGGDVYGQLFSEMPDRPARVRVIPHFASMGPPDYIDNPNAAFMGMSLDTTRGEILKGIVEGNVFSLRMSVDALDEVDIRIDELRPTGGGSRSRAGVQIAADILGKPCALPQVAEASALGCAILAGAGTGLYGGIAEAVEQLIRVGDTIEPDMNRHEEYAEPYAEYLRLRDFVTAAR